MRRSLSALDLGARLLLALIGAGLVAETLRAAESARLHMAIIGGICGTAGKAAHCPECYAVVALALSAGAVLVVALRPLKLRAVAGLRAVGGGPFEN
jgi:hypothetical protein